MAEKRYPVRSIFVAIIWAAFFYPQDRTPSAPHTAKPPAALPAVAKAQRLEPGVTGMSAAASAPMLAASSREGG
jgi:hypothetical protein